MIQPVRGLAVQTVALSAGFGLGPLATGVLAQYAPAPTCLPFVLHLAVLGAALLIARSAPDTGGHAGTGTAKRTLLRIELEPDAWRSFLRGVAPMAPFVFGFPAIAFAAPCRACSAARSVRLRSSTRVRCAR